MAMAMVTLIGENKILWLWFIVFVVHLNDRSYWPSKDHRNKKNNDGCISFINPELLCDISF